METKQICFTFGSMIVIIVLVAVALILVITGVVAYNKLTGAQNLVESSFGDIDVQLQRRAHLIPNLVAITRGYAQHEAELLEEIAQKRSEASSAEQKAENDEEIFRAIRKINVLSENYPELKASDPFLKLMENLSEIENDLMSSRRFYNGTVRVYNTTLQSFPTSIVGSFFGKKPAEFYIVSHDDQRQVTNISL